MPTIARLRAYPRLGRVSNLPTIATQTAAAVVVAGVAAEAWQVALVGVGLASAYVAGMFLNDAFDREIDARERPDRPIPAGTIEAREAFVAGAGLLAVGVALLLLVGVRRGHGAEAMAGALALAAAIVVYDAWHKGNPIAPVLMGLCRALVYVAVALALAGGVSGLAVVAALAMQAYVSGLSEVARSRRIEATHGIVALGAAPIVLAIYALRSPAPITGLLAATVLGAIVVLAVRRSRAGASESATVLLLGGLSLVDATLLAAQGHVVLAILAVLAMPVTRRLQRLVRGT